MDSIVNVFQGVKGWVCVLLNTVTVVLHRLMELSEWYHYVADTLLTTGAIIIMGFKIYDLYLKYVKGKIKINITMKINITNIGGVMAIIASSTLFILYVAMALEEKQVEGLRHYHIWGSFLGGLVLFAIPEKTFIRMFIKSWNAAISVFKSKN